ncbi:MAG: Gfo/Idh/MocA family oxidoreductase [Eubacteriales bacterium]
MKTVNFGIMGPGTIAHKFANACTFVDTVNVVAVASTKLERATTFASEFGIEKAYGNYADLLADENVDAVYISVINSVHLELITLAAKAGKAILCEKPSVVNQEEADKLAAILEETNVLFMEGMWTLHLPAVVKAKEWIAQNRIGQLKSIQSSFSFWVDKSNGGRLFEKELWGGGLLDVGVYCIAFSNFMANNMPTQIKAMEMMGDTGVDEYGTVMLRYPNNIIATGYYGVTLRRPDDGYTFGDSGYIKFDDFWNCSTISLYDDNHTCLDTFTAPHENGFMYEIAHFANLYLNDKKESDVNTIANTMNYISIFEQVRAQR